MSGKEFLTSAVAGYEIGPRVGLCMGPEHIAQGWHSGATLGVFSAAAGAARGLKLDADKTVHALGIAGTQAAGLMAAQYGAMVKRMHAGRSSQSGLYGALLRRGGLHRHRQRAGKRVRRLLHDVLALERPLRPEGAHRRPGRRPGRRWASRSSSIPASAATTRRSTRSATCRQERRFGAKDVKKIVVHGSQVTMDHVGWKYVPQGLTSAQLNLPYCVAHLAPRRRLLRRPVHRGQGRGSRRAWRSAEKVEVHHDEEITAKGAKFRHMVHVERT